jgi:hypothetical protein
MHLVVLTVLQHQPSKEEVQAPTRWQNSLGGSMMWSYASRVYKLKAGQRFILRVVPGCEFLDDIDFLQRKRTFDPEVLDQVKRGVEVLDSLDIVPRQGPGEGEDEDRGNATHRSGSGGSWYEDPRLGAKKDYGWLFYPIPGARAGEYDMRISLSGQLESLAIIDGNGDEYLR